MSEYPQTDELQVDAELEQLRAEGLRDYAIDPMAELAWSKVVFIRPISSCTYEGESHASLWPSGGRA